MKKSLIYTLLGLLSTLLVSQYSYSRGPAVEGLPQMDLDEISREENGKSFSAQYEALANGSEVEKKNREGNRINPNLETLGYVSLILAFLILLPMGLNYLIMHADFRQSIKIEEDYISFDGNIIDLSSYSKNQEESSDSDHKKAS